MSRLSEATGDNGFLARLETRPGRVFACLGLLFVLLYVSAHTLFPREHGRIINGDAIQYYAYLRSLLIDRDLDFTNDYWLLEAGSGPEAVGVATTPPATSSRPPNYFSIGPALLWAPFFVVVGIGVATLRLVGMEVPLDGISAPFPLSAGVAGIVYATLGFALCYDLCRRLYPSPVSFWATLVAWLATPAVYYTLVSPAYSHAVSLFAVALFCHTWLRTRGQENLGRFLLVGSLGGLAALVRWQDIIVLVLPVVEVAYAVARLRRPVARAALQLAALGPPVLLLLLPQMLAWKSIYGQFVLVPQGAEFMRWTDPSVVPVLFSLNHGLFSWTPAVLVAVLGLAFLTRRNAVLAWSVVGVLVLAVYVNASVRDWWAGEAFGARRFVGYTVFFALGLSALASTFRPARATWMRWSAAGLITYNLLFFLQYQVFMRGLEEVVPYPTTARQVFLDRFFVPWRLMEYWLAD